MTTLSPQDLELAKKHGFMFSSALSGAQFQFGYPQLANFLAERDAETSKRIAELEKDAARYRWLRDHYPGFASYRSGVIPYVNLDSEVDKQIAYRKRSHE